MTRKLPSFSTAMPGSGVSASRFQFVVKTRALRPELLGAAQHLGDADAAAAEAVADLLRIGPDALEAQQHHQGAEPGIERVASVGLE